MTIILIYLAAALAMVTAVIYAKRVLSVKIEGDNKEQENRFKEISGAISEGAMAFLSREYKYVAIFVLCFSVFIVLTLDHKDSAIHEGWYSAIAFIIGAFTSSVSAFLGMKIATLGNVRTTIQARKGLSEAFRVAFDSGAVMGFRFDWSSSIWFDHNVCCIRILC